MSNFEILESYLALRHHLARVRAGQAHSREFSPNQIALLYRLTQSRATMGELAEYTNADKGSVSRTVTLMEKLGLVRRSSDKDDRRIFNIELTAKGRRKAEIAIEIRNSIGHILETSLTATERKQFVALVQKIINIPESTTQS